MLRDTVFIKEVAATAITGKDAWNRPTPQPIQVSVELNTDFHQASVSDNLKYSLNYAVISRNILEFMKNNEHKNFKSLANIGESISEVVLDEKKGGGHTASITIKSTKSEIRADSIEYSIQRSKLDVVTDNDRVKVLGLKLLTIIGVFTFERLQRQIVDIDLVLTVAKNSDITIHKIINDVVQYVEGSNFKTVEALVMKIGQLIFQNHPKGIESVNAKVTKPNAISFTVGVGVSSDMTSNSFKDVEPIVIDAGEKFSSNSFNLPSQAEESLNNISQHTAYIAFGCNEGDPMENINKALALLASYNIDLISTSSLYISKPMYYKDQNDFYNGVIKVAFKDKSPHDLLKALKEIEYSHISRVKEFENGPRSIDLDIILYDDRIVNSPDLNIPHISMLERTFVLQPLCELIPPDFIHPVSAEPIHNHLKQILMSKPDESLQESHHLHQIIPIPRLKHNPLTFDQLNYRHSTLIMGILNITPDSFSDGGNSNASIESVLVKAKELIEQGSTILDIGGVSTRPGAEEPSLEEELRRIIPVVKAIRSHPDPLLANCIISIDTYRADVAEQCLINGADIINDISMGLYDERIFEVVAKYGCPYIMNHTRGNAQTMSKLTTYESNTNDDIIEYIVGQNSEHQELKFKPEVNNLINGISRELSLQMLKAFKAGVKKWQIIADPGIGFAKNLPQNLSIIRHASTFKKYSVLVNETDPTDNSVTHSYLSFNGLTTLLGPSRKKFLGTLTDQPVAANRVISTASAIIACIEQNTDIVRVHDVKEAKEAIKIGDAIYRELF
ncbi:folic acid synthesis protein [Suhomyces tanzawaensis NRRL Y-17324]|uniref:Folic acid synthesis protein fol1 n=1 Tax=Suhomyces tanzawaensis NRRL Y-17324 TaxID=984487 RepID=A0A1E4SQD5_9ASCO|nr:folic acid synthesis protein [Suhomyces tanzawaensis NRRL Y-17324]ODV81622.1 folic acid synthesis protein [Suhomyces tanzawaensis NRRL Y-17324]